MSSPAEPQRPEDGGRRGPDQPPPYVYNPYGNVSYPPTYPSYPAGLGPDEPPPPVRRPPALRLALVLLVLAAAPYLVAGVIAMAKAGDAAAAVPPEQLAQLQQLGVDLEQMVRAVGVAMVAVALVFVLLAVLAWTGRAWARALLTAMTVGFAVLVVGSILAATGQGAALDAASLLVIGGPLVLAFAGLALMFGSAARAWFSRPRR